MNSEHIILELQPNFLQDLTAETFVLGGGSKVFHGGHQRITQFIFGQIITESLSLPQAGIFLDEHISLGNNSK